MQSTDPSPPARSTLDRRQRAWRAELALVEVLMGELQSRGLARLSFWACLLTALGFLGAIFWSTRADTEATWILVRQGVQVLSWLAGLAALAVAGRRPEKPDPALLRLRGMGPVQVANAEWAAATAVVLKAIALPSLSLALLPLVLGDRLRLIHRATLQTLGIGAYAVCFSLLLGISAHVMRELSPKHGRLLLLLLFLLPALVSRALPVPSLPAFLSDVLHYCLSFGVR